MPTWLSIGLVIVGCAAIVVGFIVWKNHKDGVYVEPEKDIRTDDLFAETGGTAPVSEEKRVVPGSKTVPSGTGVYRDIPRREREAEYRRMTDADTEAIAISTGVLASHSLEVHAADDSVLTEPSWVAEDRASWDEEQRVEQENAAEDARWVAETQTIPAVESAPVTPEPSPIEPTPTPYEPPAPAPEPYSPPAPSYDPPSYSSPSYDSGSSSYSSDSGSSYSSDSGSSSY